MNPLNSTPGHASHDSVLHRVNHYREIKDRLTSEDIAQTLVSMTISGDVFATGTAA
jgi:hypothetical protein